MADDPNAAPSNDPPADPPPGAPPADPPADPPGGPNGATLGDEPGAGDDLSGAATWPEDWRTRFAGSDEADLKTLNRYKTPDGVWKGLKSLRQKMSGGEYARTKPQTDDPEILKAWRAEVGVPETPEGYLENLPEGLAVPPEDQPLVDLYVEEMHAEGVPPPHVHKGLAWYYKAQERMAEERAEADKTHRARAEDDLRSEWGPEFRGNMNGVHALFDGYAGEGLREMLFSARMDDGTLLGDHPEVLKFLANVSAEINPQGTVTPVPGTNAAQSIAQEIAALELEMKDSKGKAGPGAYWNSPDKQARLRELYELQERMKGRAA